MHQPLHVATGRGVVSPQGPFSRTHGEAQECGFLFCTGSRGKPTHILLWTKFHRKYIIRYMPTKQPPMYPAQKKLLEALGERLRLARLRRGLGVDIACERAGIARMTLYRLESGSPAVALGTLARVLTVLSLENDLELIARDDHLGRLLQDQKLPPRRRSSRNKPQSTAS